MEEKAFHINCKELLLDELQQHFPVVENVISDYESRKS